jgi:hypothetical protein
VPYGLRRNTFKAIVSAGITAMRNRTPMGHVLSAVLALAAGSLLCGTPAVDRSDYANLSAAARLGVAFKPSPAGPEPSPSPAAAPGPIALPKYIVRETQERLTPDIVLSPKAALDMAKDKYLSPLYRVTFGPFAQLAAYYTNFLSVFDGWHPNDAEALVLYRQERRLGQLAELNDLIDLEMIDNPQAKKQLERTRFELSTGSR